MTDDPLLSCRIKIGRADKHLIDLEGKVSALNGNPPNEIISDDQPDGLTRVHRLRRLRDLPDLSVIIGDAVHNLRSALDSLAVALLPPPFNADIGVIQNTYFPIREEGPRFSSRDQEFFKRIGNPATNVIVQVIQPYKGGNSDALCVLDKLSKIDRHRNIVAIGTALNKAVVVGREALSGSYIASSTSALKDGDELGRFVRRSPGDYPYTEFNFTVLINEGGIPDEPILSLFQEIRADVDNAIRLLARDALRVPW